MAIDLNRYKLQGDALEKYRLPSSGAQLPEQKTGGFLSTFAHNAVRSGGEFLGGIASAVAHPIRTIETLGNVAGGALQVGASKLGIQPSAPDLKLQKAAGGAHVDREAQVKTFEAVADFYKKRYGSVDAFKKTVYEDPVGFLGDLSVVLGGAGAAAGKAGELSKVGTLAKVGEALTAAGEATDPLRAATRGLGLGVSKATEGKTIGGGGYKPEVDAAASELGVTLPASARTSSKFTQGTEAVLGKGFFGKRINEQVAKAREQVQAVEDAAARETESAIQKATASYTGAPEKASDIGTVIQENFDKLKNASEEARTALYDAVPADVAKAPADVGQTARTVDETLSKMDTSSVSPQGKGILEKLKRDLADAQPTYRTETLKEQYARQGNNRGALQTIEVPPKRPMTFENLKATRTEIGRMLSNRVDPVSTGIKAQLEGVYASLSQDMDATVSKVSPEAKAAFDEANAANRRLMQDYNGKVAKFISKSDPEKIVDGLLKKNNETAIETVRKVAGQEAVDQLASAFTNKLFLNSAKDGVVDATLLRKNLAKYDAGTVEALLGQEGKAKLDATLAELDSIGTKAAAKTAKIETVKEALRAGTKMAEGSPTAFLNKYNIFGSGAAGAIAAGNVKLLLALVAGVVGDAAANRFFTSQLGQDFFTKGIKLEGKAGNWIMKKAPRGAGTLPQAVNEASSE